MCPLGTGSAATEGPHPGGCGTSAPTRGVCSQPDLRLLFHALVAVCHFCVYSLVSLLLSQRVSSLLLSQTVLRWVSCALIICLCDFIK